MRIKLWKTSVQLMAFFLLSYAGIHVSAQQLEEVTIWLPSTDSGADALVNALNEIAQSEYDLQVQAEIFDSQEYLEKLLGFTKEIDETPDAILVPVELTQIALGDEYLFHYLSSIPKESIDAANNLENAISQTNQSDEKLIILPVGVVPVVIIYNPRVLEELSLEIGDPLSWEQLIELSEALSNTGKRVAFQNSPYVGASLLNNFGGSELLVNTAHPNWEFLTEISDELMQRFFYLGNVYAASGDAIIESVNSGETAIVVGEYRLAYQLARNNSEVTLSLLPLPAVDRSMSIGASYGWVIPSATTEPSRVSQLLAKANCLPEMAEFILSTGALPTCSDIYTDLANDPDALSKLPNSISNHLELLPDLAVNTITWELPPDLDLGHFYGAYTALIESVINQKTELADSIGILAEEIAAASK